MSPAKNAANVRAMLRRLDLRPGGGFSRIGEVNCVTEDEFKTIIPLPTQSEPTSNLRREIDARDSPHDMPAHLASTRPGKRSLLLLLTGQNV
jgi:hypothetical protein